MMPVSCLGAWRALTHCDILTMFVKPPYTERKRHGADTTE